MAIGKIFDYKRFASSKTVVSIVLPERPRPDLVELIESAGIKMIYQAADGFTRRCAPTRILSNGLSTVETKAGLRGMIADRTEQSCSSSFNPCIVSRFVGPRSSTERTKVS